MHHHHDMVKLVDINTNDTYITKYSIKFLKGNTMLVIKELLKSRSVTDIGSLPISLEDYINESKNLTQEKLIISCFHKCYHLYNINSNPGMRSYVTSILNPFLD